MNFCHVKPDKASFAGLPGKGQFVGLSASMWRDIMSFAAHHPLINCQVDRTPSKPRGAALLGTVISTLLLWRRRIRERQAFPVLDERELRDLRLTRWDLERELAKPFWRG
jgi:uncharacterized protein YjiS (DUF1127 family)